MLSNDAVRKRLETLIRIAKDDDYASVSALIDKNHAYIQQFIQRGVPQRLKEEDRRTIARYFNVPEWELGSPFEHPKAAAYAPGFSDSGNAGIVMIPAYDIRASAGFGAFVDREWTDNYMPFQSGLLKKLTPSNPDNLSILSVTGDSMDPTLSDEDMILVDIHEAGLLNDGIYVIRNEDTLSVKRISVNPATRLLTIKSDNPLYESWPDCKVDDIHIIGKVIWVGRNL